ncbi:hypothetical protein G6W51_16905 [Streptomyces coelicolor]|nr:hypothetical protein [Streptomyces coelicolor]
MTLPDADTTPLAITAALLNEAGRSIDLIQVGSARVPWEDLSSEQKDASVAHVQSSRGKSFEQYYEVVTSAHRQAGLPVPEVTDQRSDLVRFARMRYAIIQCLVGPPQDGDDV